MPQAIRTLYLTAAVTAFAPMRAEWQRANYTPHLSPVTSTCTTKKPPFNINAASPYSIELGRGSGLYGLDMVQISQSGEIKLSRLLKYPDKWETSTINIPKESLIPLAEKINELQISKFSAAYHSDICDGDQWVFKIKQNTCERTIYLNNNFPKEIVEIARTIDTLIHNFGEEKIQWKPCTKEDASEIAKPLWASIEA